jgi:hypothetical protein
VITARRVLRIPERHAPSCGRLARLLCHDDAHRRELVELVDQRGVIDPHRGTEPRRPKRPGSPPAGLSSVRKVVDTFDQALNDVSSEERVIALVRSDCELVVELARKPLRVVLRRHAASVPGLRGRIIGGDGRARLCRYRANASRCSCGARARGRSGTGTSTRPERMNIRWQARVEAPFAPLHLRGP